MPIWLVVLFVAASSFGAGYLVARYCLKRANVKPSHKGLLVGGLSGASVFLLYYVLKRFGINLFQGTPNQLFQATLVLFILCIVGRMIWVKLRSGPVLADLGPSPLRRVFLVLGFLMLALAAAGSLFSREFAIRQGVLCLAQGILFVALGLVHSQVRSRGICSGGGLLPWNRIARYEWSDRSRLTLDLKRPRWWQDRVQLPVPPTLVDQVDQLMHQHVAALQP